MGTPDFAVPSLRAVAAACDVVAVVTQPDRPRGRGQKAQESVVAHAAGALGLPVVKPERVNDQEWAGRLAALGPDVFAVVAYGAILTPELIAVPRLGAINLHGSLLPEYRGASPVQRALWDGRSSTGVTTLWMDAGIDTGDIIFQRWAPIEASDNAATLAARLAELGAPLLADSLRQAQLGRAPRRSQPRSGGSYAARLAKHDGTIDWSLDVEWVWNRQRAVTPWPGAAARFRGRGVLVTRSAPLHRLDPGVEPGEIVGAGDDGVDVGCRPGVLRILRLTSEGRAEMAAADWARGARVRSGEGFERVEVVT